MCLDILGYLDFVGVEGVHLLPMVTQTTSRLVGTILRAQKFPSPEPVPEADYLLERVPVPNSIVTKKKKKEVRFYSIVCCIHRTKLNIDDICNLQCVVLIVYVYLQDRATLSRMAYLLGVIENLGSRVSVDPMRTTLVPLAFVLLAHNNLRLCRIAHGKIIK